MQTEERFVELMERYKRVIYKVCYVYAPPDQIEDYFQETVLALWRSYRLFRGECSHSTWIYRVALHTCLSFVRRRMRRPRVCRSLSIFRRTMIPEAVNNWRSCMR